MMQIYYTLKPTQLIIQQSYNNHTTIIQQSQHTYIIKSIYSHSIPHTTDIPHYTHRSTVRHPIALHHLHLRTHKLARSIHHLASTLLHAPYMPYPMYHPSKQSHRAPYGRRSPCTRRHDSGRLSHRSSRFSVTTAIDPYVIWRPITLLTIYLYDYTSKTMMLYMTCNIWCITSDL